MRDLAGGVVLILVLPALHAPALLAATRFIDYTTASGIDMPHTSGGQLMTGQVVFDYDGDELPDILLTTAFDGNRLYRNQGNGTFELSSLTGQIALEGLRNAGALAFDYDNDGWQDLLIVGFGQYRLFRNDQGQEFADVTEVAGLTYPGRGTSAAVADFDNSGFLDIYITNFHYGNHPGPGCDGHGGCPAHDRLYQNNGDGTFTDVTEAYLDLVALDRLGFAAAWQDYNNDGRLDLYVVNDREAGNVLWRNDGPGCSGWCFTDVSIETRAHRPAFSMGIAVGDYENNGALDFYYSSIGEQILLRNRITEGFEEFRDVASRAGVSPPVGAWGTVFADLNNDGWLDLYLNVESPQNPPPSPVSYCNRVFINQTDGTFSDDSQVSGGNLCGKHYGLAYGDLFDDGRLDLVIGEADNRYRVLRNISTGGNWLRIRPVGTGGINRDAIGTRIWLTDSDGHVQMRESVNGIGLGGGSETLLHFGLGEATPESMVIRWPNGDIETRDQLPVNQVVQILYADDNEP